MGKLHLIRTALLACCISVAAASAADAQTRGGGRVANSVAIEQQGAGNGATVVQNGAGNEATLRQFGDGNTGSITQVGDHNRVCLLQVGSGLDASIVQAGDHRRLSLLQTQDQEELQQIRYRQCTGEAPGRRNAERRGGRAWAEIR
jgi:hypothetical protein